MGRRMRRAVGSRTVVDGAPMARCPGCGDWLRLSWSQYDGVGCISHRRPGCGFDGMLGGFVGDPGDPRWRSGDGLRHRLVGEDDDFWRERGRR